MEQDSSNPNQSPPEDEPTSTAGRIFQGGLIGLFITPFASLCITNSIYLSWCIGGMILGGIGGWLFNYLPESVRPFIVNTTSFVFFAPFAVYAFVIQYALVLGVLLMIGNFLVSFFHLGLWAVRLTKAIALGTTGVLVVYHVFDIFKGVFGHAAKPTKNNYPVVLEEVERDTEDWRRFKAKLKPGDEVWYWSSPDWTWRMLVGRAGYEIVRNGRTTRHSITTGMN